ncbi:Reverse transcriptase domain and Integrase, catalytic core domain and Zinc finger, CCHC-type domain and Ribonuclease H-like domain and Aspartic peptidase domain-containing protein [Strongyloides ratti]|uniref:RNA-directed DNA polymerase n=1 Tax=Strongyloides ratti TaxID=34506 RepID=A0A090L1R0_STRRB|nr:Reverse transcriptase domain and Integrase, catalytic core domain and Zinc finger, CCHC-type domain and Ribonuclease H-like domain and Aspartic peptidase domain-containing protein [Strongyloides ratti]CEF63716.1 Reverse transcriptase domain and Integrase, catalytic core domain and Zinc finger, CCHC-type domain and Ribonuclease H-like domain and Aspartic peptidase domain-containing protein [Strongyloides ratti]
MRKSLRIGVRERNKEARLFKGYTLEEQFRAAEDWGEKSAIRELLSISKDNMSDFDDIEDATEVRPIVQGNEMTRGRNMTNADIQALAEALAGMISKGMIKIPMEPRDQVENRDDHISRNQDRSSSENNKNCIEDSNVTVEESTFERRYENTNIRMGDVIRKPENFKRNMTFESWYLKFENYCEMMNIHGINKLRSLIMYLDDNIIKEVKSVGILDSYVELCDYLVDNYSGRISEEAASYELELLLSRRVTRLTDLDEVCGRIEFLVEAKYPYDGRDRKLREMVAAITRILPAECKSKFGCGQKYNSLDEAVINAKRIWEYESQARKLHEKGYGINSNDNGRKRIGKMNHKPISTNDGKIIRCFLCNSVGHKKYQCPDKEKGQTNVIGNNQCNHVQEDTICKVEHKKDSEVNIKDLEVNHNLIAMEVSVNDLKVKGLLDTGSNCVIMNPLLGKRLKLKTKRTSKVASFQESYKVKEIEGGVRIRLLGSEHHIEPIYVAERDFPSKNYEIILGMSILKKINGSLDFKTGKVIEVEVEDKYEDPYEKTMECNIIMEDMERSVDIKKFIEDIKVKFPDCIQKDESDLGPGKLMSGPIETYDKEPYVFPIYTVPWNEKPIANELIRKLLKAGVLEPTDSQRLHPIMVVKKAIPGRYRLVADMRGSNSITKKFRYNIPNQRELFQQIGPFDYCSKLDLVDAFYQISIPVESRKNMAIRTDLGEFQFTRLVQGATNSAAELQRVLTNLFKSLRNNVHIFVDDILITSKGDVQEHKEILMKVLKICNDYELKVNLDKSKMFGRRCIFLGHILSKEGIKPSESNLEIFAKRPIPTTKRQLVGTLQSANFYRQFIPNFAKITHNLYEVTKKRSRNLKLEGKLEEDYKNLCKAMADTCLLHHANKDGSYILTTDASDYCIGACLSQIQEGKEYPISYYSQKLKKTVRGRSTTYLELLSIVKALRFYKFILTGSEILIRTDHRPLLFLGKNTTNKKYLELISEIESYNVKLKYINGSGNCVADDLSRNTKQAIEGLEEMREEENECIFAAEKRKPGRPRKNIREEKDVEDIPKEEKRRRGRPPKKSKALSIMEPLPLPKLQKFEVSNFEKMGKEDEKETFRLAHDEQGHFGFNKMKSLIESRNPNIENLDTKIKLYLKRCDVCQRRNIGIKRKIEGTKVIYESPGQNLSIDVMGPISPPAADGSRYILSAIDSFSRYSYIVPLKSYKFEEISQALMNQIFCYHGIPKSIKTDGAGNFKSEEFKKFLLSLKIEHQISSPHHSQGNCLAERTFRWISATISKICREKPNIWPQYLPMIAFYYNSTKNDTTGYSPYMLTHLREPNTLLDQFLDTYSTGVFDSSRTMYDLMESAALIRECAKESIEATRDDVNSKVGSDSIPKYEKGELILVKMGDTEKDIGSKFKFKYQGPYEVTKQEGARIFCRKEKCGRAQIVHVSNAKRYFPEEDKS